MTFRPFGSGIYTLASSIGSTDTSITLTSFLEPVSNTPYTMVLLDTDIVYATIGPKTTSSEFISFTGIVQNSNGTATLTGVTRGLAKKYPFTTSATFKLPHSGQTQFIVSDPPQLFNEYVTLDNEETIVGEKTFPGGGNVNAPKSGTLYAAPTDPLEYASKQYVDNTATGTTNVNRVIVSGIAGETILVDQLIYMKVSDGRWWKCDADTAATVDNVIMGVAQGGGTAGNSISGGILTYGLHTFTSLTLTANTQYYASNTAGGFSSTPGTTEVSVGETQSTTTILFDPRFDQQLTENQQDALAGDNTDIAVGAGNLFVTQTGLQKSAEVYAASTTGNDTYVVTLSPAPTSYVNGMTIRFKPDTANTGAATLNVNGLGAINLATGLSTALVTGDIVANQVVTVIYNSTGPVFEVVNPASMVVVTTLYTNGTTTKNISDADATQTIAHGLGRIPKKIRITSLLMTAASPQSMSFMAYNGTTASEIHAAINNSAAQIANGTTIVIWSQAVNTAFTTGTVTFDATNISIAWVKTNGPTGTAYLMWEAEG